MIILPQWVQIATGIAALAALPAIFVTGMSAMADEVKTPRQGVWLFLACWIGFSLFFWLGFLAHEHIKFA